MKIDQNKKYQIEIFPKHHFVYDTSNDERSVEIR